MKNITRKKPKPNANVLSLIDNPKFKASTAKAALYTHKVVLNLFQFQVGDDVICQDFVEDELCPDTIVIAINENNKKELMSAGAASSRGLEICSVVVAFKRVVFPND